MDILIKPLLLHAILDNSWFLPICIGSSLTVCLFQYVSLDLGLSSTAVETTTSETDVDTTGRQKH